MFPIPCSCEHPSSGPRCRAKAAVPLPSAEALYDSEDLAGGLQGVPFRLRVT